MKSVLTALLFTPIALFAQTGSISGTILDENNNELTGITVELSGQNKFTGTDENGQFVFRNLATGNYIISVGGVGFVATKENISVDEGKNTNIILRLVTSTKSLEEVTVSARKIGGYGSNRQLNTKLPSQLIDLPQSVKIIGRDFIDDRQSITFREAIQYVSGVSQNSATNDIVMRGFLNLGGGATGSAQFLNGMRNYFTGYEADFNLTNVERIEVLKGPAALLYGTVMPGGAINVITKKPLFNNRAVAGLSAGNWGRYRFDADITGAFNAERKAAYRFNLGFQSSPDYREFIFNKNTSLNAAFTFRPTENTKVDVELSHLNIYRSTWYDWGVPAFGNDLFAAPLSFTSHEPTDKIRWQNTIAMISLEHRFNSRLSLHVNMNGSTNRNEGQAHSPFFSAPMPRAADSSIRRVFRDINSQNDAFFGSAFLKWSVNTGRLQHQLTLGMDAMYGRLTQDVRQADSAQGVPAIHVFRPRYRAATTESYIITPGAGFFSNTRMEFYGIYLIDHITITPRLKALLAGRFDYYDQWSINYNNIGGFRRNINRPFIPTLGLTYNLLQDMSVYASYSKGFTPQTNQNPDQGGPWDPQYSTQYEAGIKKDFAAGRWSATAAVWQIERENILVPRDPANSLAGLISEGVQTGKGVEFDLNGSITRSWSLVAAFSYTDTRITATTRPFEKDLRTFNAPYVQASAWTRYNFDQTIRGLGIGAGVRHASGAIAAGDLNSPTQNPVTLPTYNIFEGAVYYRLGNVQFSCNVENIFNKRYIASASHIWYMQPGLPRNIMARVQVNL